jgi:hypothetical protein
MERSDLDGIAVFDHEAALLHAQDDSAAAGAANAIGGDHGSITGRWAHQHHCYVKRRFAEFKVHANRLCRYRDGTSMTTLHLWSVHAKLRLGSRIAVVWRYRDEPITTQRCWDGVVQELPDKDKDRCEILYRGGPTRCRFPHGCPTSSSSLMQRLEDRTRGFAPNKCVRDVSCPSGVAVAGPPFRQLPLPNRPRLPRKVIRSPAELFASRLSEVVRDPC